MCGTKIDCFFSRDDQRSYELVRVTPPEISCESTVEPSDVLQTTSVGLLESDNPDRIQET